MTPNTPTPLPPRLAIKSVPMRGDEFAKIVYPTRHEIWEGILRERENLIMGAPSKSKKSWFALSLGLCIAHGIPFLEHPCKQIEVIYINFELHPDTFQARLRKVAARLGVEIPRTFISWNRRGCQNDYHHIVAELREWLRENEITHVIIIIDPLYMIYGADHEENALKDFQIVVNAFDQLSAEFPSITIVIVHHFPKGEFASKDLIDRLSGTGGIARRMDNIIALSPHKEADHYVLGFSTRDHAEPTPKVLRWEYPAFILETSMDPSQVRSAQARPTQPTFDLDDLLDCLAQPLSRKEFKESVMIETGMSLTTFKSLCKKALSEGKIREESGLIHLGGEDQTPLSPVRAPVSG